MKKIWIIDVVDPRRLRLLLELSRLGSMREVADELGLTTSAVSQQLAALTREAGTNLIEPVGRRVRLTPAGLRLADHAVSILAALDAARSDLDPAAEPAGVVRVGGFATAIRRNVLPVVAALATSHPAVEVVISEFEPLEAIALLADDDLDLALLYDYNLAPASIPTTMATTPLWQAEWGLGVPTARAKRLRNADLSRWRDDPWIVNSRNSADEVAVRTLGNLTGFVPRIAHRIDSLDLVEELIAAGHGIGLLPHARPTGPAVRVLHLHEPPVRLTAYAVTRRGRETWAPLRLLRERVLEAARSPEF